MNKDYDFHLMSDAWYFQVFTSDYSVVEKISSQFEFYELVNEDFHIENNDLKTIEIFTKKNHKH